ncbi:MAG: tRNA (adenosine(37)-N6)-threonylcarbamoyltransferase complex transferase subunit TsaD [Corallococcus sp.]|nr:tRNA (adenosine(37)-N6)-threonylcarbamoyltransferase complex transferase subunit TsaD [Corallococcus sp.]
MNKNGEILILGVESSCDETACAVVTDGRKVLSDVVLSQIDIHALYGGVVPEIAGRNHVEAISAVASKALADANVTLSQIDAVAVTYGAGLVGALLVGVSFAKGLCQASGLPLIAVNHIEGHICANYLTHADLQPPYVCLLTSGGNTAIVRVDSYDSYKVLAATVDDAAGEAFDKIARVLGLPYPGGPRVDMLAQKGNAVYPFHTVKLANGNFSYSGLKTAVINLVHNAAQRGETICKEDVCASFTRAAIDGLVDRAAEELKKSGLSSLAIAGGVAANSYLRSRVEQLRQHGVKVYMPQLKLCGDNAAMIASRGYFQYLNGDFADLSLNAEPSLKLRGDKPHR